jgi:hypothetical protein
MRHSRIYSHFQANLQPDAVQFDRKMAVASARHRAVNGAQAIALLCFAKADAQ